MTPKARRNVRMSDNAAGSFGTGVRRGRATVTLVVSGLVLAMIDCSDRTKDRRVVSSDCLSEGAVRYDQ